MSVIKRSFLYLAGLILLLILYAGYQLWQNNRAVAIPSQKLVNDSLEKGIGWLVNNREKCLQKNNSILWWFIRQSADLTGDRRLQELFSEYKKRHLDNNPSSVWGYLFDDEAKAEIVMARLTHFPDYNLYFIYGLTCHADLEKTDIIRRQNDPSFCSTYHSFSPACVTHQLMGLRFAQRNHCLNSDVGQQLVLRLQDAIFEQLVWDPRLADVYIQRVLMLVESGARQRIKPVWLQRILEAQLSDGGWSGVHSLMPLGRGYHLGLGSKIAVSKMEGNFHATAQGVFLMSLLKNDGQASGRQSF